MDVPFKNVLSEESIKAFEELGEGYHAWAKANADYRANQALIKSIMNRMTPDQRRKYLFPAGSRKQWPLSENQNVTDFPFMRS